MKSRGVALCVLAGVGVLIAAFLRGLRGTQTWA